MVLAAGGICGTIGAGSTGKGCCGGIGEGDGGGAGDWYCDTTTDAGWVGGRVDGSVESNINSSSMSRYSIGLILNGSDEGDGTAVLIRGRSDGERRDVTAGISITEFGNTATTGAGDDNVSITVSGGGDDTMTTGGGNEGAMAADDSDKSFDFDFDGTAEDFDDGLNFDGAADVFGNGLRFGDGRIVAIFSARN